VRFTGADAARVAGGEVTLALRRWARARVLAGRVYRTNAGRLHVTDVRAVDPADLTDADATRAGCADVAQLRAELFGDPTLPLWRITFVLATDPDPRAALAADDGLDDAAVAAIAARLDRLDKASGHGPWTRATLGAIAERPAVRAPDLAASFGRETAPFKIDVRKLKNLGLTHSLAVGYELSPRGRAFLARDPSDASERDKRAQAPP
jgi:hypothetical protein